MAGTAIRVGLVGLGDAGAAHIEAFKKVRGADVVAVCSSGRLDEAELEARFGAPLRVYPDYPDMLADGSIDVIDICTPHHLHPEQAIAAARAGRHLIIEKPIALSFEAAREVRATIREAGVQACVCFECRFAKQFSVTRRLIDDGLLGALHYAEVDYQHGFGPWYPQFEWNIRADQGGSSLLTGGCHALDALLFLMDQPVTEVTSYQAKSSSPAFSPHEFATTSVTLLKFADGAVGKVASVLDCWQPYYFRVYLVGSEGTVLDDRYHSNKVEGMDRERWGKLDVPLLDSGASGDHPYDAQFQVFIDSLEAGRPMPLTDLETAFETHRVMFAAELSAAEGRPVALGEMT